MFKPVRLCYIPGVILDSKSRRRWFGFLCLLAAIGMLVAGETMLKGLLSALAFLACFGFTILAIFAALADARALRQETRKQQRALFENTLGHIGPEKPPRE